MPGCRLVLAVGGKRTRVQISVHKVMGEDHLQQRHSAQIHQTQLEFVRDVLSHVLVDGLAGMVRLCAFADQV